MIQKKVINMVRDFGVRPYGRDEDDGEQNGARFRHKVLLPALSEAESVIIELDGVELAYTSSFLEEAFGGVVRLGYYGSDELKKRLVIKSTYDNDVDRIELYLQRAKYGESKNLKEKLEAVYGA